MKKTNLELVNGDKAVLVEDNLRSEMSSVLHSDSGLKEEAFEEINKELQELAENLEDCLKSIEEIYRFV